MLLFIVVLDCNMKKASLVCQRLQIAYWNRKFLINRYTETTPRLRLCWLQQNPSA